MASRLRIPALGVLGLCLSAAAAISVLSGSDDVQEALAALARKHPARAERIALGAVASKRDGCWRAWLIVAAARQRMGLHRPAVEAYRRFLALCQSPAERAYVMEQIRQCRQAETPPPRPSPPSKLLSAAQRDRFGEVENDEHTESSEHFVVRARNGALAKFVAAQAEIALGRICRSILSGQDYPHSVGIYVWGDLGEYRKHAVSAAEWSGGSFSLRHDDNGRLVRRIDLTQRDRAGRFDVIMLDRVLPHELCHLVLAELFGDAHCPLALNEGLAMMAEAGVDNSRILVAGAALAGNKKIPLEMLLLMDRCGADTAAVFYAESFSLTSFLHSGLSQEQFREMLAHIKAGRPLDEAIQRALYVPREEAFLARLACAWETEAIRQSQFLHALDAEPAEAN